MESVSKCHESSLSSKQADDGSVRVAWPSDAYDGVLDDPYARLWSTPLPPTTLIVPLVK